MIKSTNEEPGRGENKRTPFTAAAGSGVRDAVDAAHFGVPSAGTGLGRMQELGFYTAHMKMVSGKS